MQLSRCAVLAVFSLVLASCVDTDAPDRANVEDELMQSDLPAGDDVGHVIEHQAANGPGGPVMAGGTTCSITCTTEVNPCDICMASAGMETSCSADCLWKDVAFCECRNGEATCGCAW